MTREDHRPDRLRPSRHEASYEPCSTFTPLVSDPPHLAFHNDLHAEPGRRRYPCEHRSPHGLQWKDSLLGREQKYSFHLFDVAAVFKLPWSWQLGESPWNVETRLITSAGVLTGADESGLMMTIVPVLALSGWKGLVTFDAGGGAGFFSNYKFGAQNFGGPAQLVATMGVRVSPFAHAYAGFRVQHFSDAGLYGSSSLGVDMYILELGYQFHP